MNERSFTRAPALMRCLRRGKAVIAVCLPLALVAFGMLVLFSRLLGIQGQSRAQTSALEHAAAFMLMIGVGFSGIALCAGVFAVVVQVRLRAVLQAAQGMLCPGCGYDLHGVESGLCPECGRVYDKAGVSREWRDEYATALPPWSPLETAQGDSVERDKSST